MAEYISKEEISERIQHEFDMQDLYLPAHFLDEIMDMPAADVRPVILCKDCAAWDKQKDSAQGRCSWLGMSPTGGWFCGNGRKRL